MFDFDGVLANTLDFSFRINKDMNEDFTWENLQDLGKGNFHEEVRKLVEKEDYVIPHNFYDRYEEEIMKINIEDVLIETIKSLSKKYFLAIVSSSSSKYIKNFLKKEGVFEYFIEILGSDIHYSKTEKINGVLKRYNIFTEDAVFITDTLGDELEASKSKVKSIGVTWGMHSKETLKKGNPAVIVENPLNLSRVIKDVLK